MNTFMQWLATPAGITFIVGLILFLVTLFFILKRIVGFVFTVVLLVACLGSLWAFVNPDGFLDYFSHLFARGDKPNQVQVEPIEELKDKIQESYNKVLEKLDQVKDKK